MKKRVNIIATGRVQEVRYRSKVRDLAKKLGILGQVQNLPDGSVEIIAEGDENTLQDFIDKIRIKNRLIEVQNLEISYSEPTGEFETFKKIISGTPEEMADRLDAAADHLEKLIDVVLMLNENVKSGNKMLAEKIDSGNKMLAEVCNKLDDIAEKIDDLPDLIVDKLFNKLAHLKEMPIMTDFMSEMRSMIRYEVTSIIDFRINPIMAGIDELNLRMDKLEKKLYG